MFYISYLLLYVFVMFMLSNFYKFIKKTKDKKFILNGITWILGIFKYSFLSIFTGYNDIILIPTGATTIKIQELEPTNNYLG